MSTPMPAALQHLDLSWEASIATFVSMIAVLFLRRLLPASEARRGRLALVLLAVSLVLRLAKTAVDAAGFAAPAQVLGALALVVMALGMISVAAMIVFDLILERCGVHVPAVVRDVAVAVAVGATFFTLLRKAGLNPWSLVTTSAVLTAIVGLALQGTITNVFAGLSLQVDHTINVGDWVQVAGHVGKVTQIKWRSTFLTTRDGDNVILPNSVLINNEVFNFSKPTREHRIWLRVGFHYRHPPSDVKRMMLSALEGVPGVLRSPPPECFPVDFGDSSIVYALLYWIDDVAREPQVDGEIRTRIWYATQRAGLEIPFPIRTVYSTLVTEDSLTREHERQFLERMAAIAKVDLFAPLEPADRELLARAMKRVSYVVGEEIIRQGQPGDSLYVVQRGEVAVRLAVEGAHREVATLRPGDFFGEMSLMTGEPRRATCAAKQDVTCWVIDREAFQHLIHAKPRIVEQISTLLASRQDVLAGEREHLSSEARARRAAENNRRLLARIRSYFNLA